MADPLSIAASIAGLVTLADIVFDRLVKYGRSVKNAEKEIQDLSREINLLGGSLNSLSRLARSLEDELFDKNLRIHHIEACNATLAEMDKKLKKLDNPLKQKLMWPFKTELVKGWLEELSRHKENINLALSANSMDAMLRLLAQEERHHAETLSELKETRQINSRIQQDAKRRKVLEFFLKYNPQKNYDMSLQLRHPRTGLWLNPLPEFQHWLSTPNSRLWLKGIPGAGKTVLAGSIIQAVLAESTETKASAFFFCDYKDSSTQAIETILGALVYQLAIQKEEAYEMLERYYQELHPLRGLPKSPNAIGLERLLKEMIELYGQVFLVIDGLDECGKLTEDVVDTLFDISEETENVSMALLSRNEDEIRDRLEEDFVTIEIAAHKEDITEYVTAEIEERIRNRRLRIDGPDLKGEILDGLINGAKGMFRWVACQLDHLGECDSDQQCRDALKTLPPNLDETYARILERVPQSKQRIVQLALHCIAYASVPLDIDELREILSVPEPGTFLHPRSIIREEAITKYCSSLIRKSTDGKVFEFSHFSVQEYLESGSLPNESLEAFRISKSRAYSLLAVECLKFLQLKNLDRFKIDIELYETCEREILGEFKAYRHCAWLWPVYARNEWENPRVINLAKALFHPRKTTYFTPCAISLAEFNSENSGLDTDDIAPLITDPHFTPLHLAAALSLPQICSFLLEHKMDVNLKSPVGTPMQCAVQGLLFVTTKLDIYGDRYLEWFVPNPEPSYEVAATAETINLLAESGASIDFKCSFPFQGKSLFQAALSVARQSYTLFVPMTLIERGVPLEETDIQSAQEIMDELLDLFEDQYQDSLKPFIDVLDRSVNQSPTHLRLCSIAWEQALFLELDFTFDATTIDTRVTLTEDGLANQAIAAVEVGNLQALQRILRDPRVEASAISDSDGDTLLHLALVRERCTDSLEIIKLLLDQRCDVLKLNLNGQQPLHNWNWSIQDEEKTEEESKIFDELAHLLATSGASCVSQDLEGCNALHINMDSPVRLKALLKHHSPDDVKTAMESENNAGYTPFSLSLEEEYLQSALIFTEEVEITPAVVKSPESVLLLAARANDEGIFEFLLQTGIDFCLKEEENPLYFLGTKSTVHFIRRLKYLYPTACGYHVLGKTPLQSYLDACLTTDSIVSPDPAILDELSISDLFAANHNKDNTWEYFTSKIVSNVRAFKKKGKYSEEDPETALGLAGSSLLRLGYLEAFESCSQQCGLLPLLSPFEPFQHLLDLSPVSSDLLCQVLNRTKYWSRVQRSSLMIRLLQGAVNSYDYTLAKILLEKGISVHQRVGEFSVLERFCLGSPGPFDFDAMMGLLLDHSDKLRMNETSLEGDGLALLHRLNAPGAETIAESLIQRGADPDLRMTGSPYSTPLVHHLLENRIEIATAIFRNGADPSLANHYGFDGVLAAAYCGAVSLLAEIHASDRDKDRINWQATSHLWLSPGETSETDYRLTGVSALHLSASGGSVDTLSFYIDNGLLENLNVKCDDWYTPLHVAALQGHLSAVRYLCARGCDVNARTKDGDSPLHLAAESQTLDVAKALVEAGCQPFPNFLGIMPAFYAYQANDEVMADWLQSIESSSTSGDSSAAREIVPAATRLRNRALAGAFEDAIHRNDLNRCKEIFNNGCSLEISLNSCGGCSPLIKAIELGRIEIIRWILREGASIIQTVCHFSPVFPAIYMLLQNPNMVEVLPEGLENYMKNGGKVLGESPLVHSILTKNNLHGLGVLLKHIWENHEHYGKIHNLAPDALLSAVVNEVDSGGRTPLHQAAWRGNLAAVQVLLENGADVNAMDAGTSHTPLHYAMSAQNSQSDPNCSVGLYLISKGANIECRNGLGQTPILQAAYNRRLPILRALVAAKADIRALDYRSFSLLQTLPNSFEGNTEVFGELVNLGLDPHRSNLVGSSAFHTAICQSSAISLLLNMDIRLEDSKPFPWDAESSVHYPWLTTAYKLIRRKYQYQTLKDFANLTPRGAWSPLCKSASRGLVSMMENLLDLGSDLDSEGCPLGSALMAACVAGQKQSVEFLVRHGAALSYAGPNGFRSAYELAKNNTSILHWLLVDRFTDQKKLKAGCNHGQDSEESLKSFKWGGPIKAELVISGLIERHPRESSKEHWARLMRNKAALKGVLPVNPASRTTRPSNLIPQESVRVHPGGYETGREEVVKAPGSFRGMLFDGKLWYISYY
ncbi:ankyrin repeat protein [Colletotrichum truncatum]|uniref:Ankyrin repeat protein n=1 Tax=Colletotrichum truncatum TaxID=5467 RepID=A0ACC3YLT7_COLTU|nr:ankyrin repeat protein [Colletotrichum truncatum]KAF6791455.1 ankyrin repeat protein [Colletotrichum truncatum]